MITAKTIGQVIQKQRKANGMSQEVLSAFAGIDRTHYSKIERGLRSPTIDTLFKIAYGLGIKPHELIKEIEKAMNSTD